MARQLFIADSLNDQCRDLVFQNLLADTDKFWEKVFVPLEALVKSEISKCSGSKNFLDNLYFMGSFSRGLAEVNSDLDLLYFSDFQTEDKKEIDSFNLNLRKVFSSYSLKTVKSLDEFVEVSDEKGLLSGWSLKPVFGGADVIKELRAKILNSRVSDIEAFLNVENETRYKRYGDRPGRINYNIKHSPGGLMDLVQLDWRATATKKKLQSKLDLKKVSLFLYKAKVLFNTLSGSDSLQLADVKKYADAFRLVDDQSFLKQFYSSVYMVSSLLNAQKKVVERYSVKHLLKGFGSAEELSHAEAELYKVRGVVLSPSYHVWTVDQHILTCIDQVKAFIEDYKLELEITPEEEAVLNWAAFFHDLKKGENGSHSVLGAKAVQGFGAEHSWDSSKTEFVSWLVREHLTLVKYSFKKDPFHPDFIKDLSLRGCEGRRAVLLFILSCADIKATNPSSWSEWKRGVLKKALDQVLGLKDTVKEQLAEDLSKDQKGFDLLEGLSVKEICMVPFSLLKEDLKLLNAEGFVFYEYEGKYWVRAYLEVDQFGFAEKFIESFFNAGSYIHHAVFKTIPRTGEVYNWVCVESGASFKAFQSRFNLAFESYSPEFMSKTIEQVIFSRIRRTFLREDYAVVSFKGEDQAGALVSAVRTLKSAGLNIEWGHAVTWGEEIEDVFGVSFTTGPDWSFLSVK